MTGIELAEFGQAIGKGAVREMWETIAWIIVVVLIINFLRNFFGWGLDETDKSTWKRSGLKLLTDHKTGVQYLSDGNGGMFVRLDKDGKPMVAK